MENKDYRYPYTYAYDYIRCLAGYNENGTKLSRSDCARLLDDICKFCNIDKEILVRNIADFYLKNSDVIAEKSFKELSYALGGFNNG